MEQILELKNFVPVGHFSSFLGLAPDDSPLLLRKAGTCDIYALDRERP